MLYFFGMHPRLTPRLKLGGGYSFAKVTWIFLALLALLTMETQSACRSAPSWVSHLPSRASSIPSIPSISGMKAISQLEGPWSRPSPSLFSIADRERSYWGREFLRIRRNQSGAYQYEKNHAYISCSPQGLSVASYREIGGITMQWPWILFRPTRVFRLSYTKKSCHRLKGKHFDLKKYFDREVAMNSLPEPLLHYISVDGLEIIPLVNGRFGHREPEGLYEGTIAPYDHSSAAFRATLEKYRKKVHRRPGYRRVISP